MLAEGASRAAEHRGKHVLEARVASPAGGEAGAACAEGADCVVLFAVLLVGKDLVGLAHLLEPLFCGRVPRILVGVVLAGKFAVGLLDFLC